MKYFWLGFGALSLIGQFIGDVPPMQVLLCVGMAQILHHLEEMKK